MNGYYPIMLQLRGKRCVVVGGGSVAERKVAGLLEAGADSVTVVSPALTERLERLAAAGEIGYVRKRYAEPDINGAALVIAATDDPQVNGRVAADAGRAGIWVATADDAARGDFINPAVVRRGDLMIAVSAAGASPSLAVRIKRELEEKYGPEYAGYTRRLGELRKLALEKVADESRRRDVLRMAAEEEEPFKEAGESVERWLERLLKLTER
ncbi:bifunctional precorrin-2 dehydrogenase/sirohydrochlorin ferrochelatase [Paenibacillus thailandensis]|uniref:precorrin-2 dehydrogenase n=1 Tax=Paenibacillus thailandensis TaxID=393250 RepID=A0ABW5QR51_9BACL